MDAEFWHQRWRENQLGFHQPRVNALLEAQFGRLNLAPGARIFLPLCGKTRDIGWLLDRGHPVVGSELSRIAVEQLFADLGREPTISAHGPLTLFSAGSEESPRLDVFVGDFFDLSADLLGPIDASYDRAALVALPEESRTHYARHLIAITRAAPQFLICFDYDPSVMEGPPFSVIESEVRQLYGDDYAIAPAAERDVEGGLKGFCPAREIAWLLRSPHRPSASS